MDNIIDFITVKNKKLKILSLKGPILGNYLIKNECKIWIVLNC